VRIKVKENFAIGAIPSIRMDEEKKENPRETNSKNDNNKSLAMTTPSSQSLPLLMVSEFLCSSLSVWRNFRSSHYPLHAPTST
jgi:hypothetical protein